MKFSFIDYKITNETKVQYIIHVVNELSQLLPCSLR